jgi:hypothetical protein
MSCMMFCSTVEESSRTTTGTHSQGIESEYQQHSPESADDCNTSIWKRNCLGSFHLSTLHPSPSCRAALPAVYYAQQHQSLRSTKAAVHHNTYIYTA